MIPILFHLLLTLVSCISTAIAAPRIPITPPISPPSIPSVGLIRPVPHHLNNTNFPPGPPPSSIDYQLPGSDLTLELSSLGFIPRRDEVVVERVLNEAFRDSIMPFRPRQAINEEGYKLTEGAFVLGVSPSSPASRSPHEKPLTWGMWTESLSGLHSYADAYPGYDFSFVIWLIPTIGRSDGYVVGSGVAFTRGGISR